MGLSDEEFQSLTREDQWKHSVDKQFQALNIRQSSQDVEIDNVKRDVAENTRLTRQIADDTSAMREAWADGVATKRFFCRLATAWEFLVKKVAIPGLVTALVIAILKFILFGTAMPDWASVVFKLLG